MIGLIHTPGILSPLLYLNVISCDPKDCIFSVRWGNETSQPTFITSYDNLLSSLILISPLVNEENLFERANLELIYGKGIPYSYPLIKGGKIENLIYVGQFDNSTNRVK